MTQLHVDFSQQETSSKPPPFRLSALLEGHTDDVRSLARGPNGDFWSTSRDGTAKRWSQRGPSEGPAGGWTAQEVFADHNGFVNSSTTFSIGDQHYFASGGQDATINVYALSPSPPLAPSQTAPRDTPLAPLQTLLGHMGNVCCIHASQDGARLISGSWDGTARVWDTASWECRLVLAEHGGGVWDVLAIEAAGQNDSCLTACADGLVRLWTGAELKTTFRGHLEAVRALAKVLPDDPAGQLFASASNDGTIRIWNFSGDLLTTLPGHGDDQYIYSVISIPDHAGGGLASAGEDGIIKLWDDEDGEELQKIVVPPLSVWTLATLDNGDLAAGCSDSLIWIFTRDETRVADETTMADFGARLAQRLKPAVSAPALPTVGLEALSAPGSKEGEIKLVETNGIPHAYQWSESSKTWSDLGEVVGAPGQTTDVPPASGKTLHEGVEYDLVFYIDVNDDPPIPLPFNFGDDIHDTAESFVKQHSLPESYLERIEDFIRFNTK